MEKILDVKLSSLVVEDIYHHTCNIISRMNIELSGKRFH